MTHPKSAAGSVLLDRNALVVDLELDAFRLRLLAVDIGAKRDDNDDERANEEVECVLLHGAPFVVSSLRLASEP